MIDVNMLPRELTGYVGHVCGLWFGSYFIDFSFGAMVMFP